VQDELVDLRCRRLVQHGDDGGRDIGGAEGFGPGLEPSVRLLKLVSMAPGKDHAHLDPVLAQFEPEAWLKPTCRAWPRIGDDRPMGRGRYPRRC
jgi:hypothetical protein